MQGFLETFDLDVEILDTIEGDSLAKAGEGFDGHDCGLGVGTGWVHGCVLDQHQGQHIGTHSPPSTGTSTMDSSAPKGQSCQHFG